MLFFADAIDIPLILGMGIGLLIPLTLFVVYSEAGIVSGVLQRPFRQVLGFVFVANILSSVAGIPTALLNDWIFTSTVPQDLCTVLNTRIAYSVFSTVVYFIVSLSIEYLWALRWRRVRAVDVTKSLLFRAMLFANLFTYSVLSPVYYVVSRPTSTVAQYAPNAKFAAHPTASIIFVDSATDHLMRVESDGTAKDTLVPFPLREFIMSPDLETFVFRELDGGLYCYHRGDRRPRKVWATKQRFFMNQVALSPSSQMLCYFEDVGDHGPYRLMLYNISSQSTIKTNYDSKANEGISGPEVAWSADERLLYVTEGVGYKEIALNSPSGEHVEARKVDKPGPIAPVFGRVGRGGWWGGDDWGVSFSRDNTGELEAFAEPGFASKLTVTSGSNTLLRVADDPGLIHFSRRGVDEVSFISGGKECVFEDYHHIYLADVQKRIVGKIADGYRHILLTPRYQKKFGQE